MFNYPYTNFHEMNLDWVICMLKQVMENMKEFTAMNQIKIANPIAWNITTQYEKSTVVIDDNGNAYLSIQPVPKGIALTNASYWQMIFNFTAYEEEIRELRAQIAATDEGSSETATEDRTRGELVWINQLLYQVTRDMLAGDQYVIDSNIEKVTIEDLIQNKYLIDEQTLVLNGIAEGTSILQRGDYHVYDGQTRAIRIEEV